ncbi:carboxypeptidase Taq [Paenibacillus shirakamiensis]|uniref:Metal-dependent carboxypeptidase n=1 Tax=Paenibacillus shirakamiensis TaxID=1265935 RepID=A0ABS4JD76_9BACL|nr:carboxypeptidase M32 [Paenibacillus shirakamiensis]MBP1999674.1 carboxypeptidase Taq [Paenibacillus shirakamiensis]
MAQAVEQTLDSFTALNKKIRNYYEAVGLMAWDLRTGAPKKAAESRSETIGLLSTEAFKLATSEEMGQYLSILNQPDVLAQLDDVNRRIVQDVQEEYDRSIKIPAEKYEEFVVLTTQSETLWEDFKHRADFAGFAPYLTKIVAKLQEFIDYWGPRATRYDTLLHMYEPDLTTVKLDQVFAQLRDRLVPLAESIRASEHQPQTKFLDQLFDKEQQKKFSIFLLEQIGYDFDAGRIDESEHPFQTTLNLGDARITTKYLQDDVTSAIFSSLHEGGHALYEQNVDPKLAGTPLQQGTSMGIHESQSRFWENVIGRSRPFWDRYYGDLQRHFPEQLGDVKLEDFHRAVNRVENSLIRIEADELTYNLHVIIRYEIEKQLFNDNLSVDDLPKVWNEKYESYLGIAPPNDGVGVLQDVHWSGGSFGYFPSYSLGNMYAAQIAHTLNKQFPNLDELIAAGNFAPIKEWLTDKIYKYGKSRKPQEIIKEVTGEDLNPDYLAEYLEQKYKAIYDL